MNVEKNRKEIVTVEETVVLTITPDQAKILRALANFPSWYEQPAATRKFCMELRTSLDDKGFMAETSDHFRNHTNF